MKIKRTKIKEVEEEITTTEFVNELFEDEWNPNDWDDTESMFRDAIEYDYPEISEDEVEEIIKESKKKFDKIVSKYRDEEIEKLSGRSKIREWLSGYIDYAEDIDEGDPGYMLSVDEIIDLIIKNGKK